jgi:hypothetical protein
MCLGCQMIFDLLRNLGKADGSEDKSSSRKKDAPFPSW